MVPAHDEDAGGKGWYVMVRYPEIFQVVRDVRSGEDAGVTFAVMLAAIGHIPHNSLAVAAPVRKIAEDAAVSPREASRALSRLCKLGILKRQDRGRFAINPEYAWRGSLTAREQALAEHDNVVPLKGRQPA